MVSFILDILLIAICVIVLVTSVKRGFVRTILSIVSSIAAVLLAVVITPSIASIFYDNFMLKIITDGIMGTVQSLAGSGDAESLVAMLETMPEVLDGIISRYNISDETVSAMLEAARNGDASIQSICETIASPVASMISNVLAFAVCFIVAVIVLKIAIAVIDGIFKFPVLNTVNKAAGLILGIVLAVVIIFVYSPVAVQLVDALGAVSPEMFGEDVIENTIIVKFFSENNIFGIIESVLTETFQLSK